MSNTFPRLSKAVLRTTQDGIVTEEVVTVLHDHGGQRVTVAAKFNNVDVWRERLTAVAA
jgi:hypothetical protein